MIKIELTKQIYHMIKNLQKLVVLGSADKPTPSDNEIKEFLGQFLKFEVTQKSGISFEIEEKVKLLMAFASLMD